MLSRKFALILLPLVTTFSLQANDPFDDPFFKDPFGDNIFKEMMQLQEEMDRMFERMHQRMQQRVSRQIAPLGTYRIQRQNQFVATADGYEYKTNIPENKENQIDLSAKDGVLSITAKIIQKHENRSNNSYSSSSSMRMYQQSIPLPHDADESTLNMGYKDGFLVIEMKKKKGASLVAPQTTQTANPQKQDANTSQKSESQTEQNQSRKNIQLSDESSMS